MFFCTNHGEAGQSEKNVCVSISSSERELTFNSKNQTKRIAAIRVNPN